MTSKKGRTTFLILIALLFNLSVYGQDSEIDSLRSTLKQKNLNDSLHGNALADLSWVLRGSEVDSAILYGKKAVSFARLKDQKNHFSTAFNNLAIAYWSKAEYDSAAMYLDSARHHYQITNSKRGEAAVSINLGILQTNLGTFDDALSSLFGGLRASESIQDTPLILASYSNIGNVYLYMEEWANAKKYLTKAVFGKQSFDPNANLGIPLNNLGTVYKQLNENGKAKYFLMWAEKEALSIDSKQLLGHIYASMGDVSVNETKIDSALYFYSKSKANYEVNDNLFYVNMIHGNLANCYSKLKDGNQTLKHARIAKQTAKDLNNNERYMNTYRDLSDAYKNIGMFDSAYSAQNIYMRYKDSLFNETKALQLTELETKYKTEQKEKQIMMQDLDIATKTSLVQKQRLHILALTGAIFGLALFALLFYFNKKAKQKADVQELIINEQEKGIKAVLAATEAERKRIAQDLHDGVGQQLTGIKLAWQGFARDLDTNEGAGKELHKLTKILDETTEDVRSISHQLMPKALGEYGLVPALKDMIDIVFSHSGMKYDFSFFNSNKRYPERVELGIFRITQELVNNAIKHSSASEVNIQIIENNKKIILTVEDNGRGFDPASVQGTGLGMDNIRSRAKALNGTLNIESSDSEGCVFTLRVPTI